MTLKQVTRIKVHKTIKNKHVFLFLYSILIKLLKNNCYILKVMDG